MREFLKGLELDKETIDTIMAEYGKNVQGLREQVDDYKGKLDEYKTKVQELTESSKDSEKMREELTALKSSIEEKEMMEKKKKDDELLTNNIMNLFGDKKFTSEYAKKGLIADIKNELGKEENNSKGIKDIFEDLTKDRNDIFLNPNQVQDMVGMQDMDSGVTREQFDKMSYKERIELKANNPELFEKYNN